MNKRFKIKRNILTLALLAALLAWPGGGLAAAVSPTAVPGNAASAPMLAEAPALEPPTNLTVKVIATSTAVSWDVSEGAVRYYIYRATGDAGMYYQLAYVYEHGYTDTDVIAGETYRYAVRAANARGLSDAILAQPVTIGEPYVEPAFPLTVGSSAFVDMVDGKPGIDVYVENASRTKTVIGFTVSVFCQDANKTYLPRDDGNGYYSVFEVDAAIAPLGGAYTGPLYLDLFSNVKYIYIAVTGIRTMDGQVLSIPQQGASYKYWAVE